MKFLSAVSKFQGLVPFSKQFYIILYSLAVAQRFVNSEVINCRQYIPLEGAECTFAAIEQQIHFTCSFHVRLCYMYVNNIISLHIGERFRTVVCCFFFFFFFHHQIPIAVANISSVEHSVNIGILDAYYVDKLRHYTMAFVSAV